MRPVFFLILISFSYRCNSGSADPAVCYSTISYPPTTSWQKFLQSLPLKSGDVIDYSGKAISNQSKHFQLINYDVGIKDLQQCADFLIRLRAEYLFSKNRKNEISFRFTDGQPYSFDMFCKGKVPVLTKERVEFRTGNAFTANHPSLRKYLDYVYTYAGTVSLGRDLKETKELAIGTVVIHPGTPGHCMIVVDEITIDGEKYFKFAEGFMPAQTPYILKNPADGTPWHSITPGKHFRTASFLFRTYSLRTFE